MRRKLHSLQSFVSDFSFQKTAWTILYRLKFHDWELYSFYRLAAHLEEPLRSQARHKMKQAFKFRNVTKPPMNSPLSIPFLAHSIPWIKRPHDGWETIYSVIRIWLFHYISRRQSLGEQKTGGTLTILMIFLAVVIGLKKEVHIWLPPQNILLVHLRIYPSLHTFECFSRQMQIPLISTADNRILNCLVNESNLGLNNMDCHLSLRMIFNASLTNSGHYIPKNWQQILAFHFRRSSIFNNGFPQKPSYIMLIMNKQNWLCFAPIVFSRRLEHMGWSRTFSQITHHPWSSATENSWIYAANDSEEIQVGHQSQICLTIRICFP